MHNNLIIKKKKKTFPNQNGQIKWCFKNMLHRNEFRRDFYACEVKITFCYVIFHRLVWQRTRESSRITCNGGSCYLSQSVSVFSVCLPPPSISFSLFLLGLLLALTHCNETQLLLKRKERVAVTALIKRLVLASRAEEALVSQRSCPIHHASHTPVQFYPQTHTGSHTQQSRQCSILFPDSTVH